MRNLLILCLFLVGALSIEAKSIVVIGNIKGVEDGVVFDVGETDGLGIRMSFNNNEENGKLENGSFIVKYNCRNSESRQFSLSSSSKGFLPNLRLQFWANQGDTVYVSGRGYLPGNWTVESAAPEQKEMNAFQEACLNECMGFQEASMKYEEYRQYRRDTDMSEEEWDRTGKELDRLRVYRDSMKIVLGRKELEVMKVRPVSEVWMDKMITIIGMKLPLLDKIKEVYRLRANEIDRKADGKWIASQVYPYPKAELGKACVDGDLYDTDGKKYNLKDFKGKYILVDFWSIYCGPCVYALPAMEKFFDAHRDKLVMISLSVDKDRSWKTSSYSQKITWHNLSDGGGYSGLAASYEVNSLPTYLLISPEGIWLKRWGGSPIFENGELEEWLKE
ncbi:TlpA family protein disulfide reductase [Phocaeicola sp.]